MRKTYIPVDEKLSNLNHLLNKWVAAKPFVDDSNLRYVDTVIDCFHRYIELGKYKDQGAVFTVTDPEWLVSKEAMLPETLDYLRRLKEILETSNFENENLRFNLWDIELSFHVCNDTLEEVEAVVGEETIDMACGEAWGREIDNKVIWEGMILDG